MFLHVGFLLLGNRRPSSSLATMNLQNEKYQDDNMYVDSGASTHITNSTGNLSRFKTYKEKDRIVVGNGLELAITHVGSTKMSGLKK